MNEDHGWTMPVLIAANLRAGADLIERQLRVIQQLRNERDERDRMRAALMIVLNMNTTVSGAPADPMQRCRHAEAVARAALTPAPGK